MKDEYNTTVQILFKSGYAICKTIVQSVLLLKEKVERGELDESIAKRVIIGQGHHRLIAYKG